MLRKIDIKENPHVDSPDYPCNILIHASKLVFTAAAVAANELQFVSVVTNQDSGSASNSFLVRSKVFKPELQDKDCSSGVIYSGADHSLVPQNLTNKIY